MERKTLCIFGSKQPEYGDPTIEVSALVCDVLQQSHMHDFFDGPCESNVLYLGDVTHLRKSKLLSREDL